MAVALLILKSKKKTFGRWSTFGEEFHIELTEQRQVAID